ncbi:MAG: hypothetical protein ACK5DE_04085 [Bacteroidota bacterium]|jgi:hypothetical protein
MPHLTAEELNFIKNGTQEYTKVKIALGELELQKQIYIAEANKIKDSFIENEKYLINKYGENTVINMQTGEIKPKEDVKN